MSDNRYSPTVAELWDLYSEIIPADASPIQRQETKRTFYAAVHVTLEACSVVAANAKSDAEGALVVQTLMNECQAFANEVQAGRA